MRNDRFITGSALDFMVLHEEWRFHDGIRRPKFNGQLPSECSYAEISAASGHSQKYLRTGFVRAGIKPFTTRRRGARTIAIFHAEDIVAWLNRQYHSEGYTPKELAKIAGCTSVTLTRYCQEGKLKHERHGRLVTIDREDGDRFAKEWRRVHPVEAV